MLDQLTLFAGDFLAKICQPQDDKRDLVALEAGYGAKLPVLLANYDPISSSWKTLQLSLLDQANNQGDGMAPYCETWPNSGIMRNGKIYQLEPWALPMKGNGGGALPTPTKWEAKYVTSKSPGDHYHGIGWKAWHEHGGPPNPALYEWAMGFPLTWTELQPLETA